MILADYYRNEFRNDVQKIKVENLENSRYPGDKSFDADAWKKAAAEIENGDRRLCFAISMFITIAVDQTMFKYFNNNYEEFRNLTLYPKFHSLMRPNGEFPYVLFQILIDDGLLDEEDITGENGFAAGDLLIDEVLNFFKDHMKEVKGYDVLRKFVEDQDIASCKLLETLNEKIRKYLDCKSGSLLLRLLAAGSKNS